MKMKQLFVVCGMVAALFLSAGNVLAQNNGGGGNGGGGNGGGRGNFDPAQFQQRMMQRVQDQLGITNDTDWSAVQPLVQKVMDAQRDVRAGGMRMMFGRGGRGGRGGNGGNGGPFGQQPDPAADALQQAIDNNAPTDEIKDLLAKYQASQQTKEAALKQAQDNLRAVLTVKQEAQATLMGLLD